MKRVPLIKLLAGTALALAVVSTPVIASDSTSKDKKEALYPNATRQEPKLDLKSEKDQKALQKGQDAVANGDKDKAAEALQPVADKSDSKYAQALALYLLANVKFNDGDMKGAIDLSKRSLDLNSLPNDTYFQEMYALAQMYEANEQYQESLETVAKWRADGRRETAESYALEGADYYRLEKYPEAIAAVKKAQSMTDKPNPNWNQILLASYNESGQSDKAADLAQQQMSANPNDTGAMATVVNSLINAQKYPEAIQLLEKARAAGSLKDEPSYVNLAKLYRMKGQESDDPAPDAAKAVGVLQDGMSKGIVTQTADNYVLLGDSAQVAGNTKVAADAYQKAVPLAKDGEPSLHAGQMLLQENKFADAKAAIQQALDKGVKSKGRAYMLLANANIGLKDKPAAVDAMEEAAKDPDTAAKAKDWLKKAGIGK